VESSFANYSGLGLPVDNVGNAVTNTCTALGSSWSLWQPDLRHSQWAETIAVMVKF
jgi:hypothetical protein